MELALVDYPLLGDDISRNYGQFGFRFDLNIFLSCGTIQSYALARHNLTETRERGCRDQKQTIEPASQLHELRDDTRG